MTPVYGRLWQTGNWIDGTGSAKSPLRGDAGRRDHGEFLCRMNEADLCQRIADHTIRSANCIVIPQRAPKKRAGNADWTQSGSGDI